MKIRQVLEAGYQPVSYKGVVITHYEVQEEFEVLKMQLVGGTPFHVSLDMEISKLDIEFILVTSFNEETANSLLLGNVAPIESVSIINALVGPITKQIRSAIKNRHNSSDDNYLF